MTKKDKEHPKKLTIQVEQARFAEQLMANVREMRHEEYHPKETLSYLQARQRT